ncbi:MAG: glycosyltransferase family 2 protein [Methylococcaceae bacterium]|nr:glycosyltransferase family 2 protein [Methylococcaceae bacterium]
MSSPKISVIIPVYNTSNYLKKCLDSIINQTLNNIEIIIVNDCSPDPIDHDICAYYKKIDQRITYIKHKNNLGLGGARNSGLNIATGDYIWFIDSDDFIDINGCEFLCNLADKVCADIIAFSATSHVTGSLNLSQKKYYYYWRDFSILDQKLSGKDFIDAASLSQSFHVSACLHLFRRELISNFRFRENVVHEDTDLIPIVIYNANSIYCVKYAPYYRLLRDDSITQREVDEKTLTDKISCEESLLNYLEKLNLNNNDALANYINKEFFSIKNLYSKFDKKTQHTESLFNDLENKHKIIFQDHPPFSVEILENSYKKRYLLSKQELETIKKSKFWKVTEYLRRIKNNFNR